MLPLRPMNKWVTRALYMLGGYALRWWLDVEEARQEAAESPRSVSRAPRRRPPPPREELKLVLVVNDSLKMGKGKIGTNIDLTCQLGFVFFLYLESTRVLISLQVHNVLMER